MSAELAIRGGTVVDGSGAPGRLADVAITDGTIEEIGQDLHGDRELDASGCVVAPGFIDIHTHYDAQVFWDPALRPSSYHGVTTVVAGNCGFTIAPTRPEHHDVIVQTLENVEDMDGATLTEGIVWDFQTHPEYMELVRRRGTVLNFSCYVGHSSVRLYVMGDAAYERAATPEEIDEMCRLVVEAIEAGAAGFSTSFAYTHRGMDGLPVPSRFAERAEVEALFMAAGSTGKGVVLATAGEQCTYADMYEWQARIGRPFTYPLFALAEGRHQPQLDLHDAAIARGAEVWPQVTPRAPHHAVHHGQPVQPQCEPGVRGAHGPGPRCPDGRLPRPRVAGPGRSGPRAGPDATALGDLRDLRVRTAPRAGRSACRRPGPGTRLWAPRRDLRGGGRGGPGHPVPHLHRQRRPGQRGRAPHPRSRGARPLRRRRPRRASCATRPSPPTCWGRGSAIGGSCPSSGRSGS